MHWNAFSKPQTLNVNKLYIVMQIILADTNADAFDIR